MKKDELNSADKLFAYEQLDRAQRKAEQKIAALREEVRLSQEEAALARQRKARLLGRTIANKERPNEAITERVKDDDWSITWDEAINAASCVWKIAMNLDPIGDVRRAVKLTRVLKVVNDRVGLAEWGDEKFQEPPEKT